MRAWPALGVLALVGCGGSVAPAVVPDAAQPVVDGAVPADGPIVLPDGPLSDGRPADATAPSPDAANALPDGATPADGRPADAAAPPDSRPPDAAPPPPPDAALPPPPDAAPPPPDARPPDAAPPPPPDAAAPPSTCEPARLTYYDVVGSGACEVMDVPAALPAIARAGLTAAIAEPWYGGSAGGAPGEACGECWQITTAHATRTVVVTDLCPIQGNPVCAGGFFHFDLAHAAAEPGELDYLTAGIVEADARRVPCPVEGNISAVLRDANPTFIRLSLASPRVAIRTVEYRGSGPGVAADNPWTAMYRDGGAWGAVGNIRRGGTGVELRLTTAQGQTVTSSVTVVNAGPFPRAVDLGVQVDDQAPPAGPACTWTVPAPYVNGLGGIDQVRWAYTSWSEIAIDPAQGSGCVSGTCFSATLGGWGGLTFYYPEDFARAGLTRLVLHARSSDAAPIEVVVKGPAGDCAGVSANLGASFGSVVVDLGTACAGKDRLRSIQVQVMRASGGSVVLDDVVFE